MRNREINGSQYAPSILGNARRIEWEGDFPEDLRAIVEPVFSPLESVIPTWCQTVYMRNTPGVGNYTLLVELSIRNRWILIRIGSLWFSSTDLERQNSMLHELCHAILEPYSWNSKRVVKTLGPEKGTPGRKLANKLLSDGLEQTVEDMARAMQKLLRLSTTPPA